MMNLEFEMSKIDHIYYRMEKLAWKRSRCMYDKSGYCPTFLTDCSGFRVHRGWPINILDYYPTYYIKSYTIDLTVYVWPINISDYRPMSDVIHRSETLKYRAIFLLSR